MSLRRVQKGDFAKSKGPIDVTELGRVRKEEFGIVEVVDVEGSRAWVLIGSVDRMGRWKRFRRQAVSVARADLEKVDPPRRR